MNAAMRLPPRPVSIALTLAFLLLPGAMRPSVAQQREPRIEVYGLSGAYSTEIKHGLLKPEFGAGALLPLSRKWAVLVDASIGVQRVNEYERFRRNHPGNPTTVFYRRNPHLANEDEFRRRVATVRPSVVRMWRRDRFSIYVGAGLGFELEHNRWRFRRVRELYDEEGNKVGLEEGEVYGTLVRDEDFAAGDGWSRNQGFLGGALIGRFGVLANVTPRTVVRVGYSCLMSYSDEPLSGAIEIGIGYRF